MFKFWCEWGIIQVWSSLPFKLLQILFLSIRKFLYNQKQDFNISSFIVLAPTQQANDLFDVISQCNSYIQWRLSNFLQIRRWQILAVSCKQKTHLHIDANFNSRSVVQSLRQLSSVWRSHFKQNG